MNLIALDDEPLALMLIERHLADIPEWTLRGAFTDAAAAADFLQHNTIDVLLTDINMPDINGLQFVRELPDERPLVIFVTAYKEHALEGYDLDVMDYLVKPVSPERFKKALQKAAGLIELRQKAEAATATVALADDHFFVFSEYQQVKITIKDILYIASMGDYVKIHLHTQHKPIITLERLKTLADRLQTHGFRRIHRSYVVNLEKIEARQKSKLKIGTEWLPVGETFLDQV